MKSAVEQLFDLAFRVGVLSFEDAHRELTTNADRIDQCLEEVLADGVHPSEAIVLIDFVKSLIYRTVLIRRHLSQAGYGTDASVFILPSHLWIEEFLKRNRDTTLCYLYLSRKGPLWAFTASIGKDLPVSYHCCALVLEREVKSFYDKLISYVQRTAISRPEFRLQKELIQQLSVRLMPQLLSEPGQKQLLFCSHSILSVLPWHTMSLTVADRDVFIDESFHSISYMSCIWELFSTAMRPSSVVAEEIKNAPVRMLAVLDSKAELAGVEQERSFFETLQDIGVPVDVVTDDGFDPRIIKKYVLVSWSSHAKSDPGSWGGSFLALAAARFTAREIADDWSFPLRPVVLLAACETSLELSRLARLDEYCGLDHGFRIAGARAVCGTMWSIQDRVAVHANALFWTVMLGLAVLPGRAATLVQRTLRTQVWPEGLPEEANCSEIGHVFCEFGGKLASQIPQDFRDSECWGVFRCFGI